jgi:hypothetical protein
MRNGQRMACGVGSSLREALSSTTNRLRFYSLFPRQRLQPFYPVGECRRHFHSLFRSTGGIDCNRFSGKILCGSGHAHSPQSTFIMSRRPDKKRGREKYRPESMACQKRITPRKRKGPQVVSLRPGFSNSQCDMVQLDLCIGYTPVR